MNQQTHREGLRQNLARKARFILLFSWPVPMLLVATLSYGDSRALPVIVAPVQQVVEFADTIEALGTTRANESVALTTNVTETVSTINFDDGQQVKKGDILVVLEKSEEEAELKAARAVLDERRAAFERASDLEKKQAMSTAMLKEREALLKQSEGNIEAIQARIANRVIKAPFDGVLGLRNISPGALLRPGDLITTIDDLDPIKVDFQVPSVFLQELRIGLPVKGTVQALGNRVFQGKINMISSQVDPVTRTLTVRALLANPNGALRPGLLMNISLSHNLRTALLIPEEAITQRDTRKFVMVINHAGDTATAEERQVFSGNRIPGEIEITKGLSPGDQVVVHGLMRVRSGSQVTIKAIQRADEPLQGMLEDTAKTEQDAR
ncbi:MAG: efflux RND transporter periplasmic adaptor subunit [Pseudomonadales bacterium]|nr:efflux RND transporter periplasmic adaptor subunit [Pseudomonadales bacterium]